MRNPVNPPPESPRAFTLLELLVVLALFVALLGILWNVIALFTRSQTQGQRLAERSQMVRSLAQLFEDDLRAAIQDPIHPHVFEPGDDDIRRFGLSGSPQSLRIDVIEINPFASSELGQQQAAIFGEGLPIQAKATELKTVFYEFRPESGLSRREIDFETPDIDAPGPEGSRMTAPEIVDCRFRYFNGSAWSDSWESLDRNGLPVAIEATLCSLPLGEAIRLQRQRLAGESPNTAARRLDFSEPVESRIIAYLPTSPIRKFEEYKRATPPKQDDPFAIAAPISPPPLPSLDPPQTPASETLSQPTSPQESWIRNR